MYTDKMMIIMRRDLKMRKGKIAAQAGHAAVEVILRTLARDGLLSSVVFTEDGGIDLKDASEENAACRWFRNGEAKICVYVDSEEALTEIDAQCREAGFMTALICDAGLTEFNGQPTLTCMAVEPLPGEQIDPITGRLPLY